MTTKQISTKELLKLHEAGNVIYTKPSSWSPFKTIPKKLLRKWKKYILAKEQLDCEIKKTMEN